MNISQILNIKIYFLNKKGSGAYGIFSGLRFGTRYSNGNFDATLDFYQIMCNLKPFIYFKNLKNF